MKISSRSYGPPSAAVLGAVGGAVLTWGWSNVIIKALTTTGIVSSFYRLWLPLPLLWLLPVFVPSLRWRLTPSWVHASLVGGVLFGIHQFFFFTSLKLTTVANVAIIGALQPALVLVAAGPMFGERATAAAMFWAAVAMGGAVLVVLGSAGAPSWSPLGDVLAVANLFAFTAYFLASKRARAHMSAAAYLTGMTTVAGIVILGVALATDQQLDSPRGWDWAGLIFLALGSGTLGHFLLNWAHPHASAFLVSTMLLAVPVVATAMAAVFIDERLNLMQIAGGAIVLGAITVIVRSTRAETGEELAESAAETDAP